MLEEQRVERLEKAIWHLAEATDVTRLTTLISASPHVGLETHRRSV
jgi:hypothetical protein